MCRVKRHAEEGEDERRRAIEEEHFYALAAKSATATPKTGQTTDKAATPNPNADSEQQFTEELPRSSHARTKKGHPRSTHTQSCHNRQVKHPKGHHSAPKSKFTYVRRYRL